MLADGQKDCAALGYAPLPKAVVAQELKQIADDYRLDSYSYDYSSYDAAPIYNNSLSEQHLVSYQARPQLTGAGALGVVYGFWAFPNFGGAGTVGTYKGAYLQQPTGAGAVTNNIGIYVEPFTKGASTNWNIYSIGGAHYFSTTVEIGGALTVDGGVALPAQVVAIGSGALASNTTGTRMTSRFSPLALK